MTKISINTLERLAILVVAVVGIVFMYGMLSMTWAGDETRPIPPPSDFNWLDSLDMTEQPTFAQMERGVDAPETTDDSGPDADVWTLYLYPKGGGTAKGSFVTLENCQAAGNAMVAYKKTESYLCSNFPQ